MTRIMELPDFITSDYSIFYFYIIFSVSAIILYHPPLHHKHKDLLRVGITFLVNVAVVFLTELIWYLFFGGMDNVMWWASMLVIHTVVILLDAIWLAKFRIRSRLIMGFVYLAASMCLLQAGSVLSQMMTDRDASESAIIIIRSSITFFCILIAVYIRKMNIDGIVSISLNLTWLSAFQSVISMFLCFYWSLTWHEPESLRNGFEFISFLGFLCMNLLFFQIICVLSKERDYSFELQAKTFRAESVAAATRMSEDRLKELRKIRHDMKNHCAYMNTLLKEEKFGELKEYFSELSESMMEGSNIIDCGNDTVNTVLNMELSKLRSVGYQMSTRLVVPPILPFSDNDLLSLLSNIIDNAMEGSQRFQMENVVIEVGIRPEREYLYICVTNPVSASDSEELLSRKTTKKDYDAHGYGFSIIQDIVERYNGEISKNIIRGRYVVDIMLDMECREQAKRDIP